MPTFSVVVCTRHRAPELERCLDSLAELDHPSYEVVVVDNTSGDREAQRLASSAGAGYVREPQLGLSRARNAGARETESELIAYLDDDAIADPGWLAQHAAALSDTYLMATTGRILPISNTPGSPDPTESTSDLGPRPLRVDPSTPYWFEIANFGGLGFGSNMVFRRGLFDLGFRFRESLGPGERLDWGEESYAFFTIIRAGHGVAYIPEAVVRHPTRVEGHAARTVRARRHSAAYIYMLMAEEPEYRGRTIRYLGDVARGHRPRWRRAGRDAPMPRALPLARAALSGLPLYLRSRFRSRQGPYGSADADG
jgi:glycosyltransferase involved in cell wall biosynthesis